MRVCMRRPWLVAGLFFLLLPASAARGQEVPSGEPEEGTSRDAVPAHVHIRHVAETFRGTPDELGLLPTAVAEAEVAARHAALAGADPSDLGAMQRHARHALHALAPDSTDGGPGAGYGVILAASRAAHWTELAMASDGAGDAIQSHGVHVATAARSAVAAAESAVVAIQAILAAEDATTAADHLAQLSESMDAVLEGRDADGDGRVGWQEGEGGLAQATQHLQLLMRGEGLVR